jgi:hypothetical protein
MDTASSIFAAVAAVAALASLWFAWKTVGLSKEAQEQYERDRQRQRLEQIAAKVSEVKWAAHHPSHSWMAPRDGLQIALDGTNESLEKCRAVLKVAAPTDPEDQTECDAVATQVEQRAECARKEVLAELDAWK